MKPLLVLLAVSVSTLLAQPGPHPRGMPHEGPGHHGPGAKNASARHMNALQEHLSLTQEQLTQLHQIQRDRMQQMRPAMQQIAETQQALEQELQSAAPDPATVGRLTLELRELRGRMPMSRDALREQALTVLTPDQQAKLDGLSEAMKLQPAAAQAMALNLIEAPHAGRHQAMWIGEAGDGEHKAVYVRSGSMADYTSAGPIGPEGSPAHDVVIKRVEIR